MLGVCILVVCQFLSSDYQSWPVSQSLLTEVCLESDKSTMGSFFKDSLVSEIVTFVYSHNIHGIHAVLTWWIDNGEF